LINFKIARAVPCLPRPQRFLAACYVLQLLARCRAEPKLACHKRAHASQTHCGVALKFHKIARSAFKSAEFK